MSKFDENRGDLYGRISGTLKREVKATDRLRRSNRRIPAKTLAHKIVDAALNGELKGIRVSNTSKVNEDIFLAGFGVPFYTIYNRIRRYDAKQKVQVA